MSPRTLPVIALLAVLVGAPVAAQDGETGVVSEVAEEESPATPPPWAGSMLLYRNAGSALSAAPGSDLSYNPYYEMSLTAMPTWRAHRYLSVGAQISVSREFTDSDWTTKRGEYVWSDLTLRFASSSFYTIPVVGIALSADLPLAFPTSRISRARTTNLALSPGISLSRRFDVLAGLTLRYGLRGAYWWHRYETGEYASSTIDDCEVDCDRFRFMESLNPTWRIANSFGVGLAIIERFGVDVSFAVVRDDVGQPPDTTVTLVPITPTDARYSNSSDVSVWFQAHPALTLSLGADTAHPQLQPDEGYYAPFFNRFTVVYLDASFDFGALSFGRNR